MPAAVEVQGPATGMGTLTLELYPDGSDTLAASVSCTEATNRKTIYGNASVSLSGLHRGLLKSGSTYIGVQWFWMTASGVVVGEESRNAVLAAKLMEADVYLDNSTPAAFQIVFTLKGTGLPASLGGTGVVLLTQAIKNLAGSNISSVDTVVARRMG